MNKQGILGQMLRWHDLPALLTWWRTGLQACLPTRWQQVPGQTAGYCLHWSRAGYQLTLAGQTVGQTAELAALEAAVADMPAGEPLTVLLAPEMIMVQEINLPLAVAENLQAVVAFELDRYSALPAEAVYFAVEPLGATAQQRLRARLYLLPRQVLAPLLARLAQLARVVVALRVVGASPQLNLLPAEARPAGRGLGWSQWLLLGLVGLLVAAILTTPLLCARAQVVALLPVVAAARVQAEQVSKLRTELETVQQSSQFLQHQKATTPQVIAIMAVLTELLPDDTWIQRLELQQADLQIRGESAAAASLIERLEAAPLLAEVNFRSPVTREPRTGRDQFHLGMKIITPELPVVAKTKGGQ